MMICKADFEDLFPDLFAPEPEPAVSGMDGPPAGDQRFARPKQDGGLSFPARRTHRAAAARIAETAAEPPHDVPDLARAGAMAAIMPAAAAYASALTMLSGYHGG